MSILKRLFQPVLLALLLIEKEIQMNHAELAQGLADLKAQNEKARAEIVAKVAALEAAIAAADSVPQAVVDAFVDLQGSVQADDDLVADA